MAIAESTGLAPASKGILGDGSRRSVLCPGDSVVQFAHCAYSAEWAPSPAALRSGGACRPSTKGKTHNSHLPGELVIRWTLWQIPGREWHRECRGCREPSSSGRHGL